MVKFDDGSSLEGVTCVEDIRYMRYLRILMRHLGAWPEHEVGEAKGRWIAYKIFLDSNSVITLIGGALFIKFNFGRMSLFDMAITYITVFMTAICLVRGITIWMEKYNKVFKDFITKIHLFNVRDVSPYSNELLVAATLVTYYYNRNIDTIASSNAASVAVLLEIHLYVHKFSHRFTLYMMACTVFAYSCFNLMPLIDTINNDGFKFPTPENATYVVAVYYALPFDYIHSFKGYMAISVINVFETTVASCYFVTIDVYLGLLMFHLWGHLKILIYNLEHFPRPKGQNGLSDRYSYQELIDVRKRIKSIVEHHNLILQFIKDVSAAFGPAIAMSYAFYQVVGCVLLFVCSQQGIEYFVRFGPMSGVLLILLVQMSFIFELISSMKDSLINAVYEMPWECMDTDNRKSVIVILQQAQRPLGLKALGMVEVGVKTMVAVIKTTISYFAMMKTMAVD